MTTAEAQWMTFAFILLFTAVIVGYDVWVITYWGPEASISRVASAAFRISPTGFAVFLIWIGVLIGHLFPSG